MSFFWASTLGSSSSLMQIPPRRCCLKVGRRNRMGKFQSSQAHENLGIAAIHWKNNRFSSTEREAPPKNYQCYASSHLLGSPGSTQPFALQYSAMSKRGSEKPGTDPRLFTAWLTSSHSPQSGVTCTHAPVQNQQDNVLIYCLWN